MWRRYYLNAIIVTAVIFQVNIVIEAESKETERDPVFIEIDPGINRLKEVIKFNEAIKRLKRGKLQNKNNYNNNTTKKSPLILQLEPGVFSNSQLKNLYAAITGIRITKDDYETDDNYNKNDNDITKLIFQINPMMLPSLKIKRNSENINQHDNDLIIENQLISPITDDLKIENQFDGNSIDENNNLAAFYLKFNPNFPRKVPPIRSFHGECIETTINYDWCHIAPKRFSKCPRVQCFPTASVKFCKPTLPSWDELNKLNIKHHCIVDWSAHFGSPNPCLDDEECCKIHSSTDYVACKSSPPPLIRPTLRPPTYRPCQHVCSTAVTMPYCLLEFSTRVTQKCDKTDLTINITGKKEKSNNDYPKRRKRHALLKHSPKKQFHPKYNKFHFSLVPFSHTNKW